MCARVLLSSSLDLPCSLVFSPQLCSAMRCDAVQRAVLCDAAASAPEMLEGSGRVRFDMLRGEVVRDADGQVSGRCSKLKVRTCATDERGQGRCKGGLTWREAGTSKGGPRFSAPASALGLGTRCSSPSMDGVTHSML